MSDVKKAIEALSEAIICAWINKSPSAYLEVAKQAMESPATDAERAAFTSGFWAYAGPANEAEFELLCKDEEQAWLDFLKDRDASLSNRKR